MVDGSTDAFIRPINFADKNGVKLSNSSLASTILLKEKNRDITTEEEAEVQRKLSQAKTEIQNLILEGQRLRLANKKLQQDIDVHSQRYTIRIYQSYKFHILQNMVPIPANKHTFSISVNRPSMVSDQMATTKKQSFLILHQVERSRFNQVENQRSR